MAWLRPGTTSDWITPSSYIYHVIKHLFGAVDSCMDVSLVHQSHGGGMNWLNLGHNYKTYHYHYDMVEARRDHSDWTMSLVMLK